MQLRESRPPGPSGWAVAWMIAVPLIAALAYTKAARTLASMAWTSVEAIDESSLRGIVSWLWGFTSLRFAGALLAGMLLQRWLLPGRRWLALPIGASLFAALAVSVGLAKQHANPFKVLVHWTSTAADQFWLMLAGICVGACRPRGSSGWPRSGSPSARR